MELFFLTLSYAVGFIIAIIIIYFLVSIYFMLENFEYQISVIREDVVQVQLKLEKTFPSKK